MKELLEEVEKFRISRGWDKHDTPNILAKSIMVEAGELLVNFQWSDKPKDLVNVKEELADVLLYSFALAKLLGLDIETIIKEKLIKNSIKYPVDL